jgi:hypothetical protein
MLSTEERKNRLEALLARVRRNRGYLEEKQTGDIAAPEKSTAAPVDANPEELHGLPSKPAEPAMGLLDPDSDEFEAETAIFSVKTQTEMIKASMPGSVEPEPVVPLKPKAAEPLKPKAVEQLKPKAVEQLKPKAVEQLKPKAAEPLKPKTVEPLKPKAAEPLKPVTAKPEPVAAETPRKPEVPVKAVTLSKPARKPDAELPDPTTTKVDLAKIPVSASLDAYRRSLEEPQAVEEKTAETAKKPEAAEPAKTAETVAVERRDLPPMSEPAPVSPPASPPDYQALPVRDLHPRVEAKDDIIKIRGEIPAQWTLRSVLDRAWKLGVKQ